LTEELVRIATFSCPIRRELVKLRLDAEGVESFGFHENVPTLWLGGSVEGAGLMVRRSDAASAACAASRLGTARSLCQTRPGLRPTSSVSFSRRRSFGSEEPISAAASRLVGKVRILYGVGVGVSARAPRSFVSPVTISTPVTVRVSYPSADTFAS